MPATRKRRASPANEGLAAGEKLKREALHGARCNLWSWVGTEVMSSAEITNEHLLLCCGLSKRNAWPICRNRYTKAPLPQSSEKPVVDAAMDADIIVISNDEDITPECSRKACKTNPNCLNHLGQDAWENEEKARKAYLEASNLGHDPRLDMRVAETPVGLKNLGATCYANAFLQVWFQDLAFRTGVYKCLPSQDKEHKFHDSPVYQLQVTFAAMQQGLHGVFNPVRLVESLQLRTTEQQDAQEFSKLFMSYLDSEFKKQSEPSLRTLIPDQFQGTQVYGTECHQCHKRSERVSEFLELEINLERNCKLEERIGALLQAEILSGDNKYLCSNCESLQDASRYTKLRQLPPVLHVSLLRFVYDLKSMERKKCIHSVTFPMVLDMDQFLDPDRPSGPGERHVYHLRGVLLHKGPSAWHGHYEAQVYNVSTKQWYQFDDESVTKLKSAPYVAHEADVEVKTKDEQKSSKPRADRQTNRRKRQMRDGTDDDKGHTSSGSADPARRITSKEAYMLIYIRESPASGKSPKVEVSTSISDLRDGPPQPPEQIVEVIDAMNAELVKSSKEFDVKRNKKIKEFEEHRRIVKGIYSSWNITNYDDPSVMVSAQAVKSWLSNGLLKAETSSGATADSSKAINGHNKEVYQEELSVSRPPSPAQIGSKVERTFSNSDITCDHLLLDPSKTAIMKRLRKTAFEEIVHGTRSSFAPELSPSDVCRTCAAEQFEEHLYQREHLKLVAQFNNLYADDRDPHMFWISKAWLKDWKMSKPKMHQPGSPDPAPDVPPYDLDVRCLHGGLCPEQNARRTIPEKAYNLLKTHFPVWQPLVIDADICAACEVMNYSTKEEQLESKRKANLEKTRLSNLHENALDHFGEIPSDTTYALLPSEFVVSWKQWIRQPTQAPRPDKVDNSNFLCTHGMLFLDPSSAADLDGAVALVTLNDWKTLEDLYSAGPLISVQKVDSEGGLQVIHDFDVCHECRVGRDSDRSTTQVNIRLRTEQEFQKESGGTDSGGQAKSILTYGTRSTRRSKRIRQGAYKKSSFKITIPKDITIKDLKLKVQEESGVPIICQRLFHHGKELDDSSATICPLGIYWNDVIDVQCASENSLEHDQDEVSSKRRRPDEGRAFDGTMLGRQSDPPAQVVEQDDLISDASGVKNCSECTYRNVQEAQVCEMCESALG